MLSTISCAESLKGFVVLSKNRRPSDGAYVMRNRQLSHSVHSIQHCYKLFIPLFTLMISERNDKYFLLHFDIILL